jgi:hypothetical protein
MHLLSPFKWFHPRANFIWPVGTGTFNKPEKNTWGETIIATDGFDGSSFTEEALQQDKALWLRILWNKEKGIESAPKLDLSTYTFFLF